MRSESLLKSLVGPLITNTQKSFQFTDEPKFHQYSSFASGNDGSGLDIVDSLAELKSLGECVERTCLATFKKKDLIKKDYLNLGKKAVDPVKFINYCELTPLKIKKVHSETLNWDTVTDYFSNNKKLLPAQLIYVPYKSKELTLRNPISSGAACALTKEEAIYKGTCELIERDAFMVTYLNKISTPKIPFSIIKNKEIQTILARFKRYFLEVHLFFLPTEFVPTILCVLVDKSNEGPAISVGAKTDFNIYTAIRGALLEAQHTRLWIRYQLMQGKMAPLKLQTLEDRGLYWAKKESIPKLSFLLNSKKTLDSLPKNMKQNKLKKIMHLMRGKNYDVYIKNLTTNLVKKQGLCVWKVIIPQLHPLYLFEDLKYHYGKRIGHGKKNNIPHPFV